MLYIYIVSFALLLFFFFFNDTATTEIYTLSLHDALPISHLARACDIGIVERGQRAGPVEHHQSFARDCLLHDLLLGERSEEHTSELQSLRHLVCRLLLEKKKK